MSFFAPIIARLRAPLLVAVSLVCGLVAVAQVTLNHRLLNGYAVNPAATVNREKPTLLTFEEADAFNEQFRPDDTGKRPTPINFSKETAIGIVLPPTSKPPKLSVSRVFVQDSVLTVRYIRLKDSTLIDNPLPAKMQPVLLLAIPKQMVLKARLIENGKVIQTITKKKDN